jgi:hypothetical protein
LKKDNEELRNMIRGRFDDGQQMITQNNDNASSVGKFGYMNTNLNQTNSLLRVNNNIKNLI